MLDEIPPVDFSSARPYRYAPFQNPSSQIRLLELLPGARSDTLTIKIRIEGFNPSTTCISYEALSYAWGGQDKSIRLPVLDEGHILISAHLESALRALRYIDRPRSLWIDALTINQEDHTEKAGQVSIMGSIYERAIGVVVWLGEADKKSDHAFKVIRATGEVLLGNTEEHSSDYRDIQNLDFSIPQCHVQLERKDIIALTSVFSRSYFTRLWILQEVGLGKEFGIVVLCGSQSELRWEELRAALAVLLSRSFRASDCTEEELLSFYSAAYRVQQVTFSRQTTSLGVLQTAQGSICSDERDRIYGILGLLERAEGKLNLKPDYSTESTLRKILQDLVETMYEQHGRLDLIIQTERSNLKPTRAQPSWIPIGPRLSVTISSDAADLWTKASAKFLPGGVLSAAGVRFATITEAFHPEAKCMRSNIDIFTSMLGLLPQGHFEDKYPADCTIFDAFCCTLVAGRVKEHSPYFDSLPLDDIRRFVRRRGRSRDGLNVSADNSSDEDTRVRRIIMRLVETHCRQRTFLTMSTGHIGLGPPYAQAGDEVVVLLGCRQPLIVRRDSQGDYELIGEAFIHGLQYGEAIFGPLPKSWTRRFGDYFTHYEFVHRRSGRVTRLDPRLRRYKNFWEPMRLEYAGSFPYNPRLTAERLKKAGIPIVDINIV